MHDKSVRCALWLQKQNIATGDVIAVCTYNQLDAYIPCIATVFVGAACNTWNHEIPLRKLIFICNKQK